MILVDTSVWIDFLTGSPTPEAGVLRKLIDDGDPLAMTGLIYAEVLQGLVRPKDLARVRGRLRAVTVLDPRDLATYEKAAELYRLARRRGRTVRSLVDCVIAAVALENAVPLLHRDRDYPALAAVSALAIYPVP